MIVQSASPGQPSFVITMDQHTTLAGALARAFGNERFESVEPRSEMLYVIDHHDAGWRELDAQTLRNPKTGLPYHLVETPFARILETSAASPAFNSRHHPFCGLISSMHSWGLYNGRYGMSEKVLLDALADENRSGADKMLRGEETRQDALKKMLEADPRTAPWIEEARLLQCYKQLQFFDTLALYFNCATESERDEECFTHVPLDSKRDTEIQVRRDAVGAYAFAPFPFASDGIELSFNGRYLHPSASGEVIAEDLARAPVEAQHLRLVRGD